MKVPPHPAKFSDTILSATIEMAARHDLLDVRRVLDPFAGVGRVFEVFPQAVGVEIEPKWAAADRRIVQGDALDLRATFPRRRFQLVFTSPCYGNRMADHHNNQDPCKKCDGVGCSACKGTGKSMRHTYRHYYGEDLQEHNSGTLQWGEGYREFHRQAWESVRSVMERDAYFILNVSDHIRNHRRMQVERFHLGVLGDLGFTVIDRKRIPTPRQRHGQNGEVRVASEGLFLLRRDRF